MTEFNCPHCNDVTNARDRAHGICKQCGKKLYRENSLSPGLVAYIEKLPLRAPPRLNRLTLPKEVSSVEDGTTLDLKCPFCGKMLKIPPKNVGERGDCNHCGNDFDIRAADLELFRQPLPVASQRHEPEYDSLGARVTPDWKAIREKEFGLDVGVSAIPIRLDGVPQNTFLENIVIGCGIVFAATLVLAVLGYGGYRFVTWLV